jgi:hypothetical protein
VTLGRICQWVKSNLTANYRKARREMYAGRQMACVTATNRSEDPLGADTVFYRGERVARKMCS